MRFWKRIAPVALICLSLGSALSEKSCGDTDGDGSNQAFDCSAVPGYGNLVSRPSAASCNSGMCGAELCCLDKTCGDTDGDGTLTPFDCSLFDEVGDLHTLDTIELMGIRCTSGTCDAALCCKETPPTPEVADTTPPPTPVDGRWSAFGSCSMACGTKTRACIPPQHGGKPCWGGVVENGVRIQRRQCRSNGCAVSAPVAEQAGGNGVVSSPPSSKQSRNGVAPGIPALALGDDGQTVEQGSEKVAIDANPVTSSSSAPTTAVPPPSLVIDPAVFKKSEDTQAHGSDSDFSDPAATETSPSSPPPPPPPLKRAPFVFLFDRSGALVSAAAAAAPNSMLARLQTEGVRGAADHGVAFESVGVPDVPDAAPANNLIAADVVHETVPIDAPEPAGAADVPDAAPASSPIAADVVHESIPIDATEPAGAADVSDAATTSTWAAANDAQAPALRDTLGSDAAAFPGTLPGSAPDVKSTMVTPIVSDDGGGPQGSAGKAHHQLLPTYLESMGPLQHHRAMDSVALPTKAGNARLAIAVTGDMARKGAKVAAPEGQIYGKGVGGKASKQSKKHGKRPKHSLKESKKKKKPESSGKKAKNTGRTKGGLTSAGPAQSRSRQREGGSFIQMPSSGKAMGFGLTMAAAFLAALVGYRARTRRQRGGRTGTFMVTKAADKSTALLYAMPPEMDETKPLLYLLPQESSRSSWSPSRPRWQPADPSEAGLPVPLPAESGDPTRRHNSYGTAWVHD